MIDFRLKTFLAAAAEGNLTRTGELLGLTQPAVTQHIKSLEKQYGTLLFEKRGRSLRLTQAGEYLKKEGDRLAFSSDRIIRELTGFDRGRRSFTIGATLTVGEFILPRLLGEYRREFPVREMEIQIGNTARMLKELQQEKLDLAVVEGPFDRTVWRNEPFGQDELVFIAAPGTPWAEFEFVGEPELRSCPLILRERGSGTREYFEEYLKEQGLSLPASSVIMEVGSLSAIKSLCEAGLGCSVMSREAVGKELQLRTLKEIPFSRGPALRELRFVYTDRSPAAFVKEFVAFCRRSGV